MLAEILALERYAVFDAHRLAADAEDEIVLEQIEQKIGSRVPEAKK